MRRRDTATKKVQKKISSTPRANFTNSTPPLFGTVNSWLTPFVRCRYSQRSASMKSGRCVELHAPTAYGHAAYDFAAGHSALSSSDYIFRDGPRGPASFVGPTLPQDLYKSPSSNDYAYIQVLSSVQIE